MDIRTLRLELLKLTYRKDLDRARNEEILDYMVEVVQKPEASPGRNTLTLDKGNKTSGHRPP